MKRPKRMHVHRRIPRPPGRRGDISFVVKDYLSDDVLGVYSSLDRLLEATRSYPDVVRVQITRRNEPLRIPERRHDLSARYGYLFVDGERVGQREAERRWS